jgi:DNA mismatch repair protein MSH5
VESTNTRTSCVIRNLCSSTSSDIATMPDHRRVRGPHRYAASGDGATRASTRNTASSGSSSQAKRDWRLARASQQRMRTAASARSAILTPRPHSSTPVQSLAVEQDGQINSSSSVLGRHETNGSQASGRPDSQSADENEIIMAIDLRDRRTVGCAYYVARTETMYFMEDCKLGNVHIIDSRKHDNLPLCSPF